MISTTAYSLLVWVGFLVGNLVALQLAAPCAVTASSSPPPSLTRRQLLSAGGGLFASLIAGGLPCYADPPSPKPWVDLDGQLGITWGGKERCSAVEENCRAGGIITDSVERLALPTQQGGERLFGRCALQVSVGGQAAGSIEIGLYGRQATQKSAKQFMDLCSTRLLVPADGQEISSKKYGPWSLDKASLLRVEGKQIVFGALKKPPTLSRKEGKFLHFSQSTDEAGDILHNQPGLLTIDRGRKGWMLGDFAITTQPSKEFDGRQIVIGQILNEEGMDLLVRLKNIGVNGYSGAPLARIVIDSASASSVGK
jgi:cyclophilin family peptidyl-prolyl cis-trans isomerase